MQAGRKDPVRHCSGQACDHLQIRKLAIFGAKRPPLHSPWIAFHFQKCFPQSLSDLGGCNSDILKQNIQINWKSLGDETKLGETLENIWANIPVGKTTLRHWEDRLLRRNILLVLKFLGLITAHPGVLKLTLKSNINGVSGSKALAPPRHQRRAMQCRAVPPCVLGFHRVYWGTTLCDGGSTHFEEGYCTYIYVCWGTTVCDRDSAHFWEEYYTYMKWICTQHTIDFVDIFKAAT